MESQCSECLERKELYPFVTYLCKDCIGKTLREELSENLTIFDKIDLYYLIETLGEEESKKVFEDKYIPRISYCYECGYFSFEYWKDKTCPMCGASYEGKFYWRMELEIEEVLDVISTCPSLGYTPNIWNISEAIRKAKHFIHVVTTTIDKHFFSLLYYKSKSDPLVEVKLVIKELGKMRGYIADLIYVSNLENKVKVHEEAHQKLVIIDGVLAFKGSANLTEQGWRREGEIREIVAIPRIVEKLNERFFAGFYKDAKPIKTL